MCLNPMCLANICWKLAMFTYVYIMCGYFGPMGTEIGGWNKWPTQTRSSMKPAFRSLPLPFFKMVTILSYYFVCLVSLLICSSSYKTIYYSSPNETSPP